MKILISFFLFTIITSNLYAQIVRASLFGNMKNINPAVISSRTAGQYTLSGEMISADKEQTLDSGTIGKAEISSQDFSFFRGGKGGGFTTEFFLKSASGEMDRVDTATDGSTETASADLSQTLLTYGMGWKFFGLGLTYAKFTNTTTGTLTQLNTDQTNTALGLSAGIKGSFGLDFGLYGQLFKISTDYNFAQSGTANDTGTSGGTFLLVGGGVGLSGKSSHFEASVEMPLTTTTVKT